MVGSGVKEGNGGTSLPTSAQTHFCKSSKSVNLFSGIGRGQTWTCTDLFLFLSLKHNKKFKKSPDKLSREPISIYFGHKTLLPFDRYATAVTNCYRYWCVQCGNRELNICKKYRHRLLC